MPTKISGKQINPAGLEDDATIEVNSGILRIKAGGIANSHIDASAAIADSKLATIATGNKVSGSAVQLQNQKALADSSGLGVVVKANGGVFIDGNNGLAIEDAKITNDHLAGSIANAKLANNSMTIGGTSVTLGGSVAASVLAAAVDGEAMALTAVTDLDAASAGNLTIFDSLLGTANDTLTIGAHAGSTVKIAGNLQVTGSLDTVSATELQVDDLTILCAKGANNAAAANNAGLKIDLGSGNFAQILYNNTNDKLVSNKSIEATSFLGNASTATALATARAINLGGDLGGSANFDGNSSITIAATIQASSVEGSMLNANVVDNASLQYDNVGNKLQIKGAGIKASHLDIKKVMFMLDDSEADVTVPAESGGVRAITLNEVGSTGTTAKFGTADAASRAKILVFINGVLLSQAQSANSVGDGAGEDGDYFIADNGSDDSHMTFTLNDSLYSGESDVVTIYGPVNP